MGNQEGWRAGCSLFPPSSKISSVSLGSNPGKRRNVRGGEKEGEEGKGHTINTSNFVVKGIFFFSKWVGQRNHCRTKWHLDNQKKIKK